MQAELALKWDAIVGEGPVWDYRHQCLYWVDIIRGHLYRFDPATDKNQVYDIGQYVGAAVPRETGGLLLALHHGFAFYDETTQTLTPIFDPEANIPENRFNDGKVDPQGRFWAGTMQIEPKEPKGSFYQLDANQQVTKKLEGIYISNGLAWSPDQQWFYYIDSLKHKIECYAYDGERGEIQYVRDVAHIDTELGDPDGMTIDNEGNLWVAVYGGGCILCINPENGHILDRVDVPAKKTSCCTFGGPNLDTLYITTISEDTNKETDPLAGSLFVLKPGVQGPKANFYQG